jgi:hypothetical protein
MIADDPISSVEKLISVCQDTEAQLKEAIAIIKSRDRVVEAALEGLDKIAKGFPHCQHEYERTFCPFHIVQNTILKMKAIHDEKL